MRKCLALISFFLLPMMIFGQKKYKYRYKRYLTSQPSAYNTESADTLIGTTKSMLQVRVQNTKGEAIAHTNIILKGMGQDTTIQSDSNGLVTVIADTGTFSLSIFNLQYTWIGITPLVLKANTKTTITASLGRSNALSIALIYSNRKLAVKELEQLISDLSIGKQDNELIKNNTCYVLWQI